MLRFDVETIYKATVHISCYISLSLRFDVETIYKATRALNIRTASSCGLM